MPHDSMGDKIEVGDRVLMTFEVQAVSQSETACNLTLKACNPTPEEENYLPLVACNSKLTQKRV